MLAQWLQISRNRQVQNYQEMDLLENTAVLSVVLLLSHSQGEFLHLI